MPSYTFVQIPSFIQDFVLLPFLASFCTSAYALNFVANATPQPVSGNLSGALIAIVESPIIHIFFLLGRIIKLQRSPKTSIPLNGRKIFFFSHIYWFINFNIALSFGMSISTFFQN